MCGICGFNWDDPVLIKKMVLSLNHRGPDDKGFYIDNYISIGHTRLSIIDLSQNGRQPIHNEDQSIWITFNGEIYNYKSLQEDLKKKGHIFYTDTDTEVIIHAYEEYDYNCLSKLIGQFSFCILDKNKLELFIARDRFGIKPLYYFYNKKEFIFASEIKAILQYDIKRTINKFALNEYFTYRFTLCPNTILNSIFKLEPSHYIIFNLKNKNLRKWKYYSEKIEKFKTISQKEIVSRLYMLLNNSVKLRMIADVPICSFLSGGIDSSIITGLASKYNPDIHTFSVGFENSSELRFAKIVSEFFNTNHNELIISNEDILKNINKMIYFIDEPIGDAAFLPTLMISELVSKNFKVVLAGEGADELFGGYDKYKFYFYGRKISKFIPRINYKQILLLKLSKLSKLNENEAYLETISVFDEEELNLMELHKMKISKYWLNKANNFQKMQFFDLNTVLPEDFFMKADKMSSAYGLEERIPYMDHNLVSFALNLPTRYKLNLWNEKYLLKRAFLNFLPKIIIKRRKRGYNAPMDYWLKTILRERFQELIDEKVHNIYKNELAINLYKKLLKSRNNYKLNFILAQKLWTIYIFEEWYRKYMI